MDERRNELRVAVESLPDCLKTVTLVCGVFQEYSATTIDASEFGMGFVSEGFDERVIHDGQDVTIKVLPYNYKLKGTIVYFHGIGGDKYRFGIRFKKGSPIEKYHELLTLDVYK